MVLVVEPPLRVILKIPKSKKNLTVKLVGFRKSKPPQLLSQIGLKVFALQSNFSILSLNDA